MQNSSTLFVVLFQPVLVQVLLLIVLRTTVFTLKLFRRLATWFQVTSFLMANQWPGVSGGCSTILTWDRLSSMNFHMLVSVAHCGKTFATNPAFVWLPFLLMLFQMNLQHIRVPKTLATLITFVAGLIHMVTPNMVVQGLCATKHSATYTADPGQYCWSL